MGLQMLGVTDNNRVAVQVTCDKCGSKDSATGDTKEKAEATLNMAGWMTRSYDETYRVQCPLCQRRNGDEPA